MTFGYECRPSFWRSVRANSHLVIAGLGTASFLGVAGLALWLAMPSSERSAFADARPEPAVNEVAASTSAAPQPASDQAAPRGDEVTPQTAAAEAAIPTLKPNDVRWKNPNAPDKPAPADTSQAVTAEAAGPAPEGDNPSLTAFAAANRAQINNDATAATPKPDSGTETAAIPTPKPAVPKTVPSADAKTAEATDNGHTVSAVTMRSAPRKGASAMITVPSNAAVQVFGCKQWCEIVYNGKRGFIYNTYLSRQ